MPSKSSKTKRSGSKTKSRTPKTLKPLLGGEQKNLDDHITAYYETKKFLKDKKILISTMTIVCKIGSLVDVETFAQKIILKKNGILFVKYGPRNDIATNRSIIQIKSKKKPSQRAFYNQTTVLIAPRNNPERRDKPINIKVFKNGSIQATGCRDMDDFKDVIENLIRILIAGYNMKNSRNQIVSVPYVTTPENVNIYDVRIKMINSNFKMGYKIDRNQLYDAIRTNHSQFTEDEEFGYIDCKFEVTGHSCVNIKYRYSSTETPSVFVFQTGSIIITGAKNYLHIVKGYEFITKLLARYKEQILVCDIDKRTMMREMKKFLRIKNSC